MKTFNVRLVQCAAAILFILLAEEGHSQGFQNMDFEQATISPPPPGYTPAGIFNPISAAAALPYWVASVDTTVCTAVDGGITIDITSVALISSNNPTGYFPLVGAYCVQLSGYNLAPGYFTSSSLAQTGLIPAEMQSIEFLLVNWAGISFDGNFLVTLNGTQIPISVISTSGNVMTMAGDVSAFAGTTAELKFTAPSESSYFLDSIVFSPQAVPEPSALSLLALGLLGLGWRQWGKVRT